MKPQIRMRVKSTVCQLILIGTMLIGTTASLAETSFTYQGQLSQSGQAAQGPYDMTFALYDADSAGNQVGVTLNETGIDVADGVFEVLLDFGDAPFNSAPRWLEIAVREAGGGVYTTLSPRQRVGASPFAIETLFVAPGAVDTAALQNGAVTEEKLAEQAVTLGKIDNGAVISGSIANGEVRTVDLDSAAVTRAKIANDAIGTDQVEDGGIFPADIDGNVFNRKGSVYVNTNSIAVGGFIDQVAVTCTGAKDLLINHACNVPSDNSGISVLFERLTAVDNDVNPARLLCKVINRNPNFVETVTATVWCLAVD
ncbi:hypothetical protein [Marinicella meishanensis]|uniref:hypothetical protein n=1 Tax=Marinicella meishanensis TaxID=2873263 RepID=UPI001CBCCB66|nr:hypothetical protein [Marinicella sp. NBU2979]